MVVNYAIDLRPLIDGLIVPLILAVLTPLIGALAAWAIARLTKLTGLQIDASQGKVLETALRNGLSLALTKAQEDADAHAIIHTKEQIIANAVNYVIPKVPDALAHFGITPVGVAQRLEARLGNVTVAPVAAA